VVSVDIGIELWERYGLNVTKSEIQAAIVEHIPDYEAAQAQDPRVEVLQPASLGNGV
jgi:hypothetical protein